MFCSSQSLMHCHNYTFREVCLPMFCSQLPTLVVQRGNVKDFGFSGLKTMMQYNAYALLLFFTYYFLALVVPLSLAFDSMSPAHRVDNETN